MNGELHLRGYKFSKQLNLNLQDKTVLTGEDSFIAFEIFNMLESYFSKKTFSDYYLDNGTILILNGNKLTGSEFAVFRLPPTVDLLEELKITKKSILGQVINALFNNNSNKTKHVIEALQTNILSYLNTLIKEYGISFDCKADDIFAFAKTIQPVVTEIGGQDILLKEHDQYYCKTMLLDLIIRLKIDKRKLLLVELPEYGLKVGETIDLLKKLSVALIDNVIIHTNRTDITKIIPKVFNYHVIKNGKLYGFDDYDELEEQLKNIFINISEDQIEQKVIEYILNPECNCFYKKSEFSQIVDRFLN